MCSTLRAALVTLLTISLVLTIGRQVLDFVGRLWLPIFVNFLHILFVIFGLFGAAQFRLCFVITFVVWAPVCIAYNAFIGCFFMQVGDIFDRNSLYLSAGLRQSYSFWLRHTFLCNSHYNLSTGLWMQDADCFVPYYFIETGQAILHGLVVLLAFIIALCFLCTFHRKTIDSNMYSGSLSRRSKQPTITVQLSDPGSRAPHRVSALPNGTTDNRTSGYQSDNYDLSSGYMNSSYDESPTLAQVQHGFMPTLDNNGRLVQGPPTGGYQRRISAKRRTKRQVSKEHEIDSDIYAEGSRRSSSRDDYSAATTAELHSGRRRSRSNSRVDMGRPAQRTRSVSPIRRVPSATQMEVRGHGDHEFPGLSDRRPRSSSVKAKPFKHYLPNNGVSRIPSQDRLVQPSRSVGALQMSERDGRRLSSTEVRGLRNSTDSALNGPLMHRGRKPPPNLTSLVSFDPKSNTLIRVQEHMNQSRDLSVSHETLDSSQDSAPSIVAPALIRQRPLPTPVQQRPPPPIYGHHHHHPPSADRISFDSGLPSSSNGANSDWSSGASSRQPIGYEPALVDRAPSFYEPVYRPTFYKPPPSAQQPAYQSHYHTPKGLLTTEVLMAYESVDGYEQRQPATVPMINDQSLLV